MRRTMLAMALCSSACTNFDEGGLGTEESSSSSTTDNPVTTVTTTATSVDPTEDPSSESSGDPGESTEPDASESSSDDGESTESSTGEPSTDFALFFDGNATASATQPYGWNASDFNVEVWIEIRDAENSRR